MNELEKEIKELELLNNSPIEFKTFTLIGDSKGLENPIADFEFKFSTKGLDDLQNDPNGYFEGYASVFGIKDDVGDIVVEGAFKRFLLKFKKDGWISNSHSWQLPRVGCILDAYEDHKGFYIKGMFHSHELGQTIRREVMERMAIGQSVKLSIGYKPTEVENLEGIRLLKEIYNYEVAFVTVPALYSADVTTVKSIVVKPNADLISLELNNDSEVKEFGFNGVLSDLKFDQHATVTVSTVQAFIKRANDIHEYRKKEGRVLNANNRTILSGLLSSLDEVKTMIENILSSSEKPEKSNSESPETKSDIEKLDTQVVDELEKETTVKQTDVAEVETKTAQEFEQEELVKQELLRFLLAEARELGVDFEIDEEL